MKTGKSAFSVMVQVCFGASILFFFWSAAMAECPGFTEITGAANPFSGISIGENPALVDIDNDGDLDLFLGSSDGKIHYFKNNYPVSMTFTRKTGSENPLDGISVGDVIKPCFADINGDGKPDLFFSVAYEAGLYYYENTGTAAQAVFTNKTGQIANPFNGISIDVSPFAFKPAFADIDGDGDLDAIFGMDDGEIKYYKNTGSNVFEEQTGENNPFFSVFSNANPEFGEAKGLIVGEKNTINHYTNIGTSESPQYDSGCQITGAANKYYYPAFGDLFGNGELKLVLGMDDSSIAYYSFSDILPGDIDGKGGLTLADAIVGLKILAAADISGETVNLNADVNSDGMIGQEEVIFVLREIAQID